MSISHLQKEIAEMSGDATVESSAAAKSSAAKSTASPSHHSQQGIQFGDDEEVSVRASSTSSSSVVSVTGGGGAAADPAGAVLSRSERGQIVQEALTQLTALCTKLGVSADSTAEITTLFRSQVRYPC